MDADGKHRRRIAALSGCGVFPVWSSRGIIAMECDDGGIWTISASGKGQRRHGPSDGGTTNDLAWSPDGTKLAFTHGDGDWEVFVMNADGTGLTNLTDNKGINDGSPSWSADGKAIAFVSDRDEKRKQIFVMRADGSRQTQLTDDRRGPRDGIGGPDWSPAAG
jgi:Tol biopolymer transport system component